MKEKPDQPQTDAENPEEQERPPPFDPDPDLVTYLERGRKSDAKERFRKDIEKEAT